MKTKFTLLMVTGLCAGALAASAQVQSGRIVTVDLNKVFNEYYKTPVASQKLKDTADQYNKEHEEMMAQYRKQVDELNKLREEQEKTEYTPEVREQKRKAFQEKLTETQKTQREIEEFRASHRQILDQQQQRMRQGIVKEINDVIVKEARDAGYAFVLDKSGNSLNQVPVLVYSQDAVDITDDIIRILNKSKPAETPAEKKPADKK